MKTIRIMICAFIVIFVSDAAFAKIYRLKDKDGNYYYKDIPEAGDSSAETVQLKTEASIPGQKDLAAASIFILITYIITKYKVSRLINSISIILHSSRLLRYYPCRQAHNQHAELYPSPQFCREDASA